MLSLIKLFSLNLNIISFFEFADRIQYQDSKKKGIIVRKGLSITIIYLREIEQ